MRTSWEKLVQYVGANYGQDISNELQNKVAVALVEPIHTPAVTARHATRETMIRNGQANIQTARRAQEAILQAAVAAGIDPEAPMKLATSGSIGQRSTQAIDFYGSPQASHRRYRNLRSAYRRSRRRSRRCLVPRSGARYR
jgi:hypothetical protein